MNYKGYLIDLDGTMYRGEEAIHGAKEFVDFLNEHELPHLFVTNNSSTSPDKIAEKLSYLKIKASPNQILTSARATAQYLTKDKQTPSVYMIGEFGLADALSKAGCQLKDDAVDYVVMGIDREINYTKLQKASLLIQQGARFISTNKDPAIPKEVGLLPGNGALTKALETASGQSPIYIGKPESIMMSIGLDMLNLKHTEVLMVGDNYVTDIRAGIDNQIDTLMVLTGFSQASDIVDKPIDKQPTYVKENLLTWLSAYQTY